MLYIGATIKCPYLSESSVLFYVSTTPFSSTCERSNSGTASLIPRIFPLTVFYICTYILPYFIFQLLSFTYIYVSFFFQLICSFNVIHIFCLCTCIGNCVFTCMVVKGGKRAIFRKVYQCLAYNRLNDNSIYEEMHLRGSTNSENNIQN